ncbi:17145_t:CDS:2, partial [Acaulospora morrowiae]
FLSRNGELLKMKNVPIMNLRHLDVERRIVSSIGKIQVFPRRGHNSQKDHSSHSGLSALLTEPRSRGTKITLIGLGANIGLTFVKGVAGWVMNSASLLADAAHSLSDLISDFVTLYTFQKSRKPPDATHPYGYGKYETVGSLAVSTLLIFGALGIGYHSYELLISVIPPDVSFDLNSIGAIQDSFHQRPQLNPNAAWFATASVLVKEALYRSTIKIGLEERSDVLVANAWHHRSDAASSLVALVSIAGSYIGFPFLDPLGGILVAGMIMKSGMDILISSLKELVDVRVEEDVINHVKHAIQRFQYEEPNITNFHSIRGRKSGPFYLIDMVLQVKPDLTVARAHHIEEEMIMDHTTNYKLNNALMDSNERSNHPQTACLSSIETFQSTVIVLTSQSLYNINYVLTSILKKAKCNVPYRSLNLKTVNSYGFNLSLF